MVPGIFASLQIRQEKAQTGGQGQIWMIRHRATEIQPGIFRHNHSSVFQKNSVLQWSGCCRYFQNRLARIHPGSVQEDSLKENLIVTPKNWRHCWCFARRQQMRKYY